ncbi:MAG: pitrilysin family protein [Bacteroidales bacterium]|nr:pitrilysin family protein [Bacteroidales bacterium]
MITFSRHVLANGLRVLVCEDPLSPMATFNMLYTVGARNENPERTGFAHLFEHLMFGGSANVPDFDYEVQRVGGDANAFTNNDYTNYYVTLPADNIETAFWLESDRLCGPAFSQESLDIQKKVVIEEFRQRYLNAPYGDIQHIFRDLVYKVHPYRWPTIGLNIEHIENATLDEVKDFFYRHYTPSRAILAVSGNVKTDHIFALAEKWFGDIRRDAPQEPAPPAEPVQTEARTLIKEGNVPATRIMIAFHSADRLHRDTKLGDLMTDVFADGLSSRLIQRLVKESRTCTDANAYITGSFDPGAVIFSAQVADGVKPETAIGQIWDEIHEMQDSGPTDYEINKARNRQEAAQIIGETASQTMSQTLATYEMLGDANLVNTEYRAYDDMQPDDVMDFARRTCTVENSSTLIYRSK